ncbi:pyrroloquinoline quinone biosynthesis peptide chaperone PqqD [Geodermatophilus poikilotrophus]|uniref:Pyrroloquinoline quinone biosynthesis protein D n=1 Tax=Geodermatophilus poikilotrophus TaxID=1333667 RepID=A0A1H9Z5V9_9ACTN|nr:pyrroloquinoline quinone biosynthesis peptide chaperone PqqD [Geodermatophilus poikilotrophus]SES76888.1 pyrroloquinoline quinone biosynthesis protein D [Geodermatophilus poikilotrophus]
MRSTAPAQTAGSAGRPRLARSVRLRFDPARGRSVLLTPEAVTVLNGTGAAVLELCDGRRTTAEIVAELRGRYAHVDDDEVRAFVDRLTARRWLEIGNGEAGRGQARHGQRRG